jgi:hypothetical protein
MLESAFPFYDDLLLHVPTRKMSNLLDTCKTYIEYIEEASFYGLCEVANERYLTHQG